MTAIRFENVTYLDRVRDLTFNIPKGQTLVLLGESGSGKTTTLKLINHLLVPTSGTIIVGDKTTLDWNPIELRRSIGYVIQEGGLFPHFTVARNVALVPKLQNWNAARIQARVDAVLRLVGLEPDTFRYRYPHELSGGQRQRVGVARALAADPEILLMDEPFGALDPITRAEIQREFKQLQSELNKTVVFVTHDVTEALLVGSRIALLQTGELHTNHTTEEFLVSSDPYVNHFLRPLREASAVLR